MSLITHDSFFVLFRVDIGFSLAVTGAVCYLCYTESKSLFWILGVLTAGTDSLAYNIRGPYPSQPLDMTL